MRWTVRKVQELHKFLDQYRKRNGKYRRGAIVDAAAKFKVCRNTIYNVLKAHPTPPQTRSKNLMPKYTEDFYDSETVKNFLNAKGNTKRLKDYARVGLHAWKILRKKDPEIWDEEDYEVLWNHEKFRDPETGKINYSNAVALRQWMDHAQLYDLKNRPYFTTKGLKRLKGRKLAHWISTEEDLVEVIESIEYPDTLMMFNLGIQCGARFSSLRRIKPEDIIYTSNTICMREYKINKIIERVFLSETLSNLRVYIDHYTFKAGENIFPRSLHKINEDLRQAGKKASLPFNLTSHVAMKHTFVSFASNHGVSFEVVAKQTGTNPSTLMEFYAGIGTDKIRHELLGEKYRVPDFDQVMRRLQPLIKTRFEKINMHPLKTARKQTLNKTKIKKKRQTNWLAIEKMVQNLNTPIQLREYWVNKLKKRLNEG